MASRRFVSLDPDAVGSGLFVVVEAESGVFYRQQYGGSVCRGGQIEGFLVPVEGADALSALREMFEGHFGGAGTWGFAWVGAERERLGAIVGAVRYWACDGTAAEVAHPLRLDDARIAQVDEPWVPVVTPDGPGVMVWANSD